MSSPRALVLTYHSICDGPPPLCTPPRDFEAQLELLERAGLEIVPLAAVVEHVAGTRTRARPIAALTFDDAYLDFAEAALPLLERRRLPGTLFATASTDRSRLPGGPAAPLLLLEALRELPERGVEIGAHGIGHVDLTQLGDAELTRELDGCRDALAERTGRPVRWLAYPFGRFDARVRAAAAERFEAAFTTALAPAVPGGDLLAIPRIDAHYLRSPFLRWLLRRGRESQYLRVRRALRRARGSEPRRPPGPRVTLVPRPGGPPGAGRAGRADS